MQNIFLFPGQGSQYVGMGSDLLDEPICKQTFDQADQALGFEISNLMAQGPESKLTQTEFAQPAILTVSVAVGRVLLDNGYKPVLMAGHSLGEYSALVLSGAMAFDKAVQAVHHRGKYMQEAVPEGQGTMSAILGASDALIEEVCQEITAQGDLVEPANYNCPGQLVISGSVEGVQKAMVMLKEKGAKRCVPLSVSAPFHSSMLKPASQAMQKYLESVPVQDPKIPYIANVDVETIFKADQIKPRLVRQIDHPVRWTQTLQTMVKKYPNAHYVEVGASKVVSGHIKKVHPSATVHTTASKDQLKSLLK